MGNIIRPDIAVITQIGESHLEGFGSIERIAAEKSSIAKYVQAGGAIIANGDNPILIRLISHPQATIFSFGTSEDNDIRVSEIKQKRNGIHFLVNGKFPFFVPIIGRHNAINCLAAIIIARRMGFEMEEINEALQDFSLPDMRLTIKEIDNVTFINDAYNANPVSMSAAIDVLNNFPCKGKKILCFGQMLELGKKAEQFHCEIARKIGKSKINCLIAIGEFAKTIRNEAIKSGLQREKCFVADNAKQAKEILENIIETNDVVLIKGSRATKMETIIENITTS